MRVLKKQRSNVLWGDHTFLSFCLQPIITLCHIFLEFTTRVLYKKTSKNREFCENRLSARNIGLNDPHDFQLIFSIFFSNFGMKFVILCTHVISLSKKDKAHELVNVN